MPERSNVITLRSGPMLQARVKIELIKVELSEIEFRGWPMKAFILYSPREYHFLLCNTNAIAHTRRHRNRNIIVIYVFYKLIEE